MLDNLNLYHNSMMLLYVLFHPDVHLIQSGDMHVLLKKVYSFTTKFHVSVNNNELVLAEGAFVATQR